jgi:hypothetical protein
VHCKFCHRTLEKKRPKQDILCPERTSALFLNLHQPHASIRFHFRAHKLLHNAEVNRNAKRSFIPQGNVDRAYIIVFDPCGSAFSYHVFVQSSRQRAMGQ